MIFHQPETHPIPSKEIFNPLQCLRLPKRSNFGFKTSLIKFFSIKILQSGPLKDDSGAALLFETLQMKLSISQTLLQRLLSVSETFASNSFFTPLQQRPKYYNFQTIRA